MPPLTVPALRTMVNRLFADPRRLAQFNLLYEVLQGLLPSEDIVGNTTHDFVPEWFAGMAAHGEDTFFLSISYSVDGTRPEPADALDIIAGLEGSAALSSTEQELISGGAASTAAAVGCKTVDGATQARLYWNPALTRDEAVTFLKTVAKAAIAARTYGRPKRTT